MNRVILSVSVLWISAVAAAAENELIAINVLLVPDKSMMDLSTAWNDALRDRFPDGFALDDAHVPHVTLLQRHISKEDLDAVLLAVESLQAEHSLEDISMIANGLYHIPAGEFGLAGITIELSQELKDLQSRVIEVINPYDAGEGDQSAYVPDLSGMPFDPQLFEYVTNFLPIEAGDNFNPHVTIGLGPKNWLEEVEQLPFNAFSFGAVEVAVYQLGNFGTAALRLER